VARERRAEWRPLIEGYVRRSPVLRGLVLLLDARREPSPDDRAMLDFLADVGLPTLVAITKMDKYGTAAGADRVAALVSELELDPGQVIPVSATTGMGRDELAEAVVTLARSPSWR
jgi:GTP-binding protein